MKLAIATVATREYLQGAELLFGSLALFNDLTSVDLVCISDIEESEKPQALKGVDFFPLVNRGENLAISSVVPRFGKTIYKFQALQLLADGGYDFVVLMDSDMLCTGPSTWRSCLAQIPR